MGFTIEVEFLRGLFEAGDGPQRAPAEWPPGPARVFCALVAAAGGDDGHDATLQWLEAQEPPAIEVCDELVHGRSREGYVPLNQIDKSSYGRFPARKGGAKQEWFHVAPREPIVRYHWTADPSADVRHSLTELADAVPYLGRSTSPVAMRVVPTPQAGTVMTRLVAGGLGRGAVVAVPARGYLDALRTAFAQGASAHEVPRRLLRYGRDEPAELPGHRSAFGAPFLVLPFAESKRVGAAHTMLVSNAVRKALEACLDGGPLVLRGARPGEERPEQQVLILLLPQVGHEHASGLAAGIAVVLPAEVSAEDRHAIYQGLVQLEINGVAAGRLGRLRFAPTLSTLSSLDPMTWSRPSRRWVSATPMTLDRFLQLHETERVETEVRRACGFAGLPEPSMVEFSALPLAPGAPQIPARLRQRRAGEAVLPSVHVRLRFDEPVEGPVVLGNLRRYGLGLCVPEADR